MNCSLFHCKKIISSCDQKLVECIMYSCHCLNVRIYADKLEETPETGVLENCPFGSSGEIVELIEEGFNFSHKCLVHRLRDKDWTVYMCVPCCMKTHAVKLDAKLVVVSTEMRKSEDAIQMIKTSPDFSSVFNILLNSNDGRQKGNVQPQSYETLQKQLGDLQTVLSAYLKQEEEAMEKRIRNFEENERIKYEKLKEKAQQEKTKLISVLFNNSQGKQLKTVPSISSTETNANLRHSRSANVYNKEAVHLSGSEKQLRKIRDSSPDVFDMDELDAGEGDVFLDSSAQTSNNRKQSDRIKDTSVQQFGRIQPLSLESTEEIHDGHAESSLFSTSVPILMPAQAMNLRRTSYLEDELEEYTEFDDIPKNMQALSESIQEQDRYIFGDRPHHQLHTGDFTQVNWH